MSRQGISTLSHTALLMSLTALLVAGCPNSGPASSPTNAPVEPAATTVVQLPTEIPTEPPTPTPAPATAAPTKPPTAPATPTALPPTPTTAPPTDTPTAVPTDTPTAAPRSQTTRSANLRAGPGTNYAVVGSAAAQEAVEPLGRNEDGDWLQVNTSAGEAWIAAFLVENVDPAGLPVRGSTAPTVTPVAQLPSASSAAGVGASSCSATFPAPTEVHFFDQVVDVVVNGVQGTQTQEIRFLSWRWNEQDQLRGLDWYFELQFTLGRRSDAPVLRSMPVNRDRVGNQDGQWTTYPPGAMATGYDSNFFRDTCPAGEPRCPLHVRVQVAMRDNSGSFACFISAPSNIVQMPMP